MADAGGAFVTRAFERMLKDAQGKKYINLQNALKEYLDRPRSNAEPNESSPRSPPNEHDETAAVPETPTSPVHSPTAAPGSPARRTSSQVAAAAMAEAGGTLEGSEADLLWLPLRLAFETKQPKLVESALDCLHKLISYGHLEGDAGIESGKNGEMLTEILNKVCSCIDSTATDSTVLQVIKVLLTTVTSSKFRVHGECLLSSIRTCYTIVLNSKSSVNQATAKATLTQMINIVFKRMESEVTNSDASWRAHKEESCKTADASSSGLTVEELQHADIKGLEAALDKAVQSDGGLATNEGMNLETLKTGQRDALLIFRTLCKMSMKEGTDDMIIRTKILSLELLQGLMESVNRSFTVNFAFIDSVKAYLCYGLLRACVSLNIAVFQLACGLFLVLLQRFRESLKAEIGIFFPLIVLRSLDSVDTQLQQRTCVLKMLERTCMDPQILADIFVNYDCDLEATNLFERMVGSLSKMVQGTSPDPDLLAPAQSTALKSSSLQCLVNVLRSLISWSAGPDDKEKQKVLSEQPPTDSSQADTFGKAKAHKSTVEAAIFEFNRNPGKGIEMLISNKLVEHETRAVAKHLRTTPGLDKAMIGDYLGQHEEFQVAVMHAYVDDMNFKELKFDEALREFLRGFRLPGEAQKIDRIMEKFAERYCRENPGIFQNADTAYILAYAVILLNTDAHNPMVWPKMSKEDFVRINSENDAEEHAPTELLEELYESIVQREILVNDNSGSLKRDRKHDMEEEGRLINVLNLGVPKKKTGVDAKHESEEIIQRTQELIKKKGARRGIFYEAKHADLARPMLEAVGWSLLAAFSVTMEDSESKPRVALCMEGFRSGIHLTKFTGMDTLRYAFLTSLIRLTFLHAPKDMRSKNVEALKTLLALAGSEPKTLQDTWNAVLECVSRLEYITSSPSILATLMHGSNQISRDALAQALIELTGKPTEQIFVNTVKLPSDAIVEFFTALCGVSAEELKQNPPRVFSLQKLVEISYYNMARIRMVWARIWSVLSQHFVAAGSHHDEKIAMYAIDSLRQLGMKYFERPELANFTFQNDILKPFVVLMRTSRSARIRALILDCKIQLIKSKVGSIKSGWKSVFMVFTTAAHDDNEEIADLAFENVEQVILEYFDQMAGDCFMDCVNCLITFANNKISSRTSLKAIALLRICENRLAEGQVSGKTAEDADVSEYNWFPMLAGLSDLTSDPRVEVRNCALEVLFDLLKERGHHFSTSFWESVFHRVLFPIFDYVRHAGKNGEKPASAEQWLRETCLHSLQLLCDLFSTFYKEVSFLLPSLLSLLLDCATRPDQALAAISIGALVRLSEVGGHQFTEKDWTTLLDSIRDACYTTQPIEILNLDNGVGTPTTGTPEWDSAESQSQTQGQTQTQSQGQIQDSHQISSNSSISNGPDASDPTRRSSFDAREADAHDVPTHIEAEGFNATPPAADSEGKSGGIFGGGRRLVGNVVDALLKKNLTFKARSRLSGSQSPPPSQLNNSSIDDVSSSIGIDDDESENPLLPIIRSKCLTQLLLLGAIDSFQNKHWQRLATSHKIQIMDTLLSMLDFASSYNSDSNFRNRIQQMSSGDIPPPNLLRQEVEGTRVYVAVVNKATADEDEKLREEAERRLVAFYSHILKDAVNVLSVEPHPHPQSLCLRSSVIVKVLRSMSEMESGMFRRHLSEFYPCFTKLICSNQVTELVS